MLLDDASATLTDDGKIGFIGRNGAGKSTLLKVILGEEELDSGEIVRHPKLRLGYLRQHDPFLPGETVQDFLVRDSGCPAWKCGEVAGQFEIKAAALAGPAAKPARAAQPSVADAIALQQTATYRLSKVRHEVKVGDQLWTVDEFEGDHDGLVIDEIKLADIPVLPDWVWREVTGDPQYSNVQLAQS